MIKLFKRTRTFVKTTFQREALEQHKKSLVRFFETSLVVTLRTFGLILIYYLFSIGITFYQKWFIKVKSTLLNWVTDTILFV